MMFWYPKGKDYEVRDNNGVTLKDFLKNYNPNAHDRPAVTADSLIFSKDDGGLKILLIRRGRHPSFGKLALPGGFIEMDESLEDAAARELFEETGLAGVPLAQLGAYGGIGRDPRMRIVSVAYMAVLDKDAKVKAGDDAAEAVFYSISLKHEIIDDKTVYRLSFSNRRAKAGATIVESAGKRMIAESDIAADHSVMILDALERFGFIENN
jgi:8-oxo-dGTP diphosphatase